MNSDSICAPEKLTTAHDLSQFECGELELDDWLRRRAIQNEESGASRTYVVCIGRQVVGYYALAASTTVIISVIGSTSDGMKPDLS